VHTVYSDGACTPEEVVQAARKQGLIAISITDHDSVGGVAEAQRAGQRLGVEVIPGVEMSTDVGRDEFHILGYYVDVGHPEFRAELARFQEYRRERNQQLVVQLGELGMPIAWGELEEIAPRGFVGRLHIARVMEAHGYVGSIGEAFEEWLNPGQPAHVEKVPVSPFAMVRLLRAFSGVPVIAHPALSQRDDLIPSLVEAGLEGIEVYHRAHDRAAVRHYRRLAQDYDLVMTGGTDCHGLGGAGPKLGTVEVPDGVLPRLKARVKRVHMETASSRSG